jgi:hypothetical protein
MLDTSHLLPPGLERRRWAVLVELSVMEQRYQAGLAVVSYGWKVVVAGAGQRRAQPLADDPCAQHPDPHGSSPYRF